jgi:ATP-dependent helicase/DNAse subunit B
LPLNARRKFVDTVKVDTKDEDSARIVAPMDELFAIDREAREKNMDQAARHALRMEEAPHQLEQIRAESLSLQNETLPKSTAGKAASYTLSLWK